MTERYTEEMLYIKTINENIALADIYAGVKLEM